MRHSLTKLFRLFALSAALLLGAHAAQARDTVCRMPGGIQGFSAPFHEAEKFVGGNTRSLSGMKIYVTVENGALYTHSNFITRGFDVPTKIATSSTDVDLLNIVYNLVGPEENSGISYERLEGGLRNLTLYVDQKFFANPKFNAFDVESAGKVFVIDSEGVARPTMYVRGGNGRPRIAMEFQPSLFALVNDPNVPTLKDLYRGLTFQKDDVRLLPLTLDSMTAEAVKTNLPAGNVLNFDLSSIEALDSLLVAHRGKTVFPLGHMEGDSFVTRDAGGKTIFKISLGELEALAKKHNVSIFALGCNSASSTSRGGVLNVFNTLDAVNRFQAALSSSDYMQFFDNLSGDEIFILLDDSVLGGARERLSMSVRKRSGGGAGGGDDAQVGRPVRDGGSVGRIVILNPTAYRMATLNTSTPTPTPGPSYPGKKKDSDTEPYQSPEKEDSGFGWLLAVGGLVVVAGGFGIWKYNRG